MTKQIEITGKNFNRTLTSVMKSESTIRDKIGLLIMFGLTHFVDSADSNPLYLTKIMEKAEENNSSYTGQIKRYIQAVANVSYVANKNGDLIFKKKQGESATVNPEILAEIATWYLFGKSKKAAVNTFRLSNFSKKLETVGFANSEQLRDELARVEAYEAVLRKLLKPAQKKVA